MHRNHPTTWTIGITAAALLPAITQLGCRNEPEEKDADEDGYFADEDCDDNDPEVNPGADELKGDTLDNDCDLAVDCEDDDLTGEWEGDLVEADVQGFCAQYCARSVAGSVTLDGTALADLQGLNCLTGVGGDLLLLKNDDLASISGLASLETVGGNLSIGEYWCEWTDQWECTGSGNPALVSLDGLQNLATVGGWLFIADNDALVDPGVSFDALTTIGGATGRSLLVDGHAALTRLPDFPLITTLPAFSEVWGNDALETLDGLGALTTVDTDLWLAFNPMLPSPLGLDALVEVKGTLGTADNGFTTMAGLSGLQSVGGALEVWDHAALVSLEGLESLESVGPWFTIINNDALVDLSGLDGLTMIAGDLNIMDNDAMVTVDGAPLLTDIGGSLQILPYAEEQANDLLVDLSGLYGLEEVTGNVLIVGNPVLTDDEAWALVAEIETIGGAVKVVANE